MDDVPPALKSQVGRKTCRLSTLGIATCHGLSYRKSNPDVLMVQTSEVRVWHDAANGLNSTPRLGIVPVGNSHSDILVLQSAQDRHGQHATDGLGGARDRRVLVCSDRCV
jgi:hypothetical protein